MSYLWTTVEFLSTLCKLSLFWRYFQCHTKITEPECCRNYGLAPTELRLEASAVCDSQKADKNVARPPSAKYWASRKRWSFLLLAGPRISWEMTNSQLRLATQNINSAISNIWHESRRPNKNECFSELLETRAKILIFKSFFNVFKKLNHFTTNRRPNLQNCGLCSLGSSSC